MNQAPPPASVTYQDSPQTLYYYGARYYSPSLGRWLSRDPIGEAAHVKRSGRGEDVVEWVSVSALYSYCVNGPLTFLDAEGLSASSLSELVVKFTSTGHTRAEVSITFTAGSDSGRDGKTCPCKHPKLAQAVSITSQNAVQYLLGYNGHWFLDTDAANAPFYPFYTGAIGYAAIHDKPGTSWYAPLNWAWGVYFDFEACAVCTDDGPGRYWVISCADWGQHVGGIGHASRYGAGLVAGRSPATAAFLGVFPGSLLGP